MKFTDSLLPSPLDTVLENTLCESHNTGRKYG